ncbi:PadR family transcriptional regulator [Paenibacillus hodogayensis]|uniref:PadR family transcriptional regulator n=1 Tax=Paenibacillus hodogayensis TaxID=279208 RepID=A0ABV5W5F6_9BACL
MSSSRYALLSLLAREPLSGYDIKQQMNNRLAPFWKIGSNQVYPELTKMEEEGLIRLQGVEQHTYRPARKLYEITEAGRQAIIAWTVEPVEMDYGTRDDFLLKTYNTWLIDPQTMVDRMEHARRQHEERLFFYESKAEELKQQRRLASPHADPIASTLFVIEFGIRWERLYIQWCEDMIKDLAIANGKQDVPDPGPPSSSEEP